jgi:hypothetical protein
LASILPLETPYAVQRNLSVARGAHQIPPANVDALALKQVIVGPIRFVGPCPVKRAGVSKRSILFASHRVHISPSKLSSLVDDTYEMGISMFKSTVYK